MTVKNLNLAIPMELYVALKRDAELVAAPVTTHIRGVLMRYIRSTDEAVQARKAEATAAARPLGAQQQALAEYQAMVDSPFTLASDEEASAWIQRRASLVKLAGNRTDLMRIPAWFGDQAHASLNAFDPANTIDWVLRKGKATTEVPAPTVQPWNEPDREGESPVEGAARRDAAWAEEARRLGPQ